MRSALAALLLANAATLSAQDSAPQNLVTTVNVTRAWQDTITLPTWAEGAPDIHPRFDALDPEHSFYPYTARTNLTKSSAPESWRRLNLENEYLRCSFLPDLGGHLYSCTDKRNGRPMFHANPSIKKDLIGPRGAWVALGIEFNFPVAHSRDTVSPVDFGIRQENGQAQVWLADTDRVTGMRWVAAFILRDGSAALEQRMAFSNPGPARHPYLYWANAGVTLDAGTRFAYPAYIMATHGQTELLTWPRDKRGRDMSRPMGIAEIISLFAYGSREPFMAVYNATTRTATVHVADPAELVGKKLYHWGTTNLAGVGRALSDDGTVDVEMQAGLFPNQETYGFLQPGERIHFSELWMPGRDLAGVSRANEHAILSLERDAGGNLTAQLNVTHAIAGARLAIYAGASRVWQDTADLSPAKTYEHTLTSPESGPYRFELCDSSGKLLLQHTEKSYEAVGPAAVKLGAQPAEGPGDKREKAADFLAAAERNEELSLYLFAEHDYRMGLAKFKADPDLEKALGRLLVTQQRYSEAYVMLSDAAKKLTLDPELRFYLGLAEANTARENDARQSWESAAADKQFGPAALAQLAMLESRAGHAEKALEFAQQAAARRTGFLPAVRLEAALLRRANRADAARKAAEAGFAADPLDLFLRVETTRMDAKDEALWSALAGDPERVLEVAGAYLDMGLPADALDILARPYEPQPANRTEPGVPPPSSNALVTYYRAYAESLCGKDAAADFALAASQPLAYVYPHSAVADRVLQAALQNNSQDASALYLTGLLYLSENRMADAANEWNAALAIRKDLPAIHYLLGRTLLMMPGSRAEAIEVLKQGASLNPADKEIKKALDEAMRSSAPAAAALPDATDAPPPAPKKNPTTPDEIAQVALEDAARGEPNLSYFATRNVPQPKVSDAVMQAYVEVQLQLLRRAAVRKDCATALAGIDKAGAPDPDVAFSALGFDRFTKGARYQYFLGAVDSLCGQTREAKRIWNKVARMTPAMTSPDFAFPAVAQQSANAGKPDWNALIAQVNKALETASFDAKGLLDYSNGILLLARGDEHAALEAFQEGTAASDGDFAQYLNLLAVFEATHARSGQ